MELSNNQPKQTQPVPISAATKIFCCVVLLICSVALSSLTFYIGVPGVNPAIPVSISAVVTVLCVVFALVFCKGIYRLCRCGISRHRFAQPVVFRAVCHAALRLHRRCRHHV